MEKQQALSSSPPLFEMVTHFPPSLLEIHDGDEVGVYLSAFLKSTGIWHNVGPRPQSPKHCLFRTIGGLLVCARQPPGPGGDHEESVTVVPP